MTTFARHCTLAYRAAPERAANGGLRRGRLMKLRSLIGALALGLALAACGSQGDRTTEIAAPAKSFSDLPAYQQIKPHRVSEAGAYVHRWSGMTLPTTIGQLKRAAIMQFDRAALDVSGDYQA